MINNYICFYNNIKIIDIETKNCRYEVPHKIFEKLRSRFIIHLTSVNTAKEKLPCFKIANGIALKACFLSLEKEIYHFHYEVIKVEGNFGFIKLISIKFTINTHFTCKH